MINFSDYNDFFIFLGGLLILGGIIYLFFRRPLQNIFIAEQEAERLISEEEISKLRSSDQVSTHKPPSSARFLFQENGLITASLHPWIKNPRFLRSLNKILLPETFKNVNLRFSLLSKVLLVIIIGGFLFNQFLMWKVNSSGIISKLLNISITITKK